MSAALALALAGCITQSGEQQLGDEEAKKVEEQMGFVRDPALVAYVRALGAKLVAVSERPEGPWTFEVVDTREPNAFALPGGHVYVTRGLLVLTNSEDELAGVIGHEMAHVTARHSVKRIGAAVATAPVTIATGLAGFAVGIVSPMLGSAVAGTGEMITNGLVIAPYSREQEHDADEIGQALAAKAGYDPAALARFLHTLDRDFALQPGEKRTFHFLDSHPLTPDRVARLEERAPTLTRAASSPIAAGRSAFVTRLDGLVVGEDPAQGVFQNERFLHPDLGFALDFPAGWTTQNTNESVGAISPSKDAAVVLHLAAQDSSLDQVLKELTEKQSDLSFERIRVNGLPAARTTLSGRGQVNVITLIELQKTVYGVVGQSADSTAKQYGRVFRSTAGSFRALSAKERQSIRESRLRVRPARAGETPAAIAKRTSSTWDADRVAVANGVAATDAFQAGWPVKLALPQAYAPRGR
ncbi:MAG TPA: M48 family metalloprotease [Myxococcota bacterium]|nr:M48 family metalloprotease [Myxococcota bacterium]